MSYFIYATQNELKSATCFNSDTNTAYQITDWQSICEAIDYDFWSGPLNFLQFDLPNGNLLLHTGWATIEYNAAAGNLVSTNIIHTIGQRQWSQIRLLRTETEWYCMVGFSTNTNAHYEAYVVNPYSRTLSRMWTGVDGDGWMDYPLYTSSLLSQSGVFPQSEPGFADEWNAFPPGTQITGTNFQPPNNELFLAENNGAAMVNARVAHIGTQGGGDGMGLYGNLPTFGISLAFHEAGAPLTPAIVWTNFTNSREIPA